jgi:hypothetical protein
MDNCPRLLCGEPARERLPAQRQLAAVKDYKMLANLRGFT